jgi:CubicO group peptidase (beta-lactamase class C family)
MLKKLMLAALAWSAASGAQVVPSVVPAEREVETALAALRPGVEVVGRQYPPESLVELMRKQNVPAVSIAVVRGGRIVAARAFGEADPATRRAATTETLFQAASISKPVAATAALRLVEQGRLQLDRPVNEQLTSWRLPDAAVAGGEPVTLRRLLGHTAGLTVSGFPGYAAAAPLPNIVQILDGAAPANTEPVRIDLRPGSVWRYSGGGITLAQLLMTDATRKPFPVLMDRLVLRPLRMSRSSYLQPLPANRADQAALAHGPDGTPLPGRYHVYPEMAAAGLWTTPSDLARWAIALSAAYNGKKGGILRPKTAAKMLTPGLGDWGLGLSVRGEGEWLTFSHSGSNEGYRAILIAYPRRGEAVIIMTNGENGGAIMGPVTQAVGRVLGWPNSNPQMITPAAISGEERAAVVGRYGEGDFIVTVSLTGDALTLSPGGATPRELVPQGSDAFVSAQNGTRFQFNRDPASKRVVSISGAGRTLPRLP